MKNIIKIKNRVIIFIICIFFSACTREMPSDFRIVVCYGINKSVVFDSYNSKVTVHQLPSVSMPVNMSSNDLEILWKLTHKYNLNKYNREYIPKDDYYISPSESYYINYTENGNNHVINWEKNVNARDYKSRRLRRFIEQVREFVILNSEFEKKVLPVQAW